MSEIPTNLLKNVERKLLEVDCSISVLSSIAPLNEDFANAGVYHKESVRNKRSAEHGPGKTTTRGRVTRRVRIGKRQRLCCNELQRKNAISHLSNNTCSLTTSTTFISSSSSCSLGRLPISAIAYVMHDGEDGYLFCEECDTLVMKKWKSKPTQPAQVSARG